MGRVISYVLLLLMLPLSFAYIIESGDNGAQFVNETAAAKCQEPDVQAVYTCLGNVVRVVSSVPGEGSTFYKPEGKVIRCPVVQPSEIGAECLQMMTPNFCPTQEMCGESPSPWIFPGQNDTAEQVGDEDYYIEGEAASGAEAELQAPNPKPAPSVRPSTLENANSFEIQATSKNNLDSPIDLLAAAVLLLGAGAVGVLFFMFRNSLAEDEL